MPIFLCGIGLVIVNSYLINRLYESELLNKRVFLFGFLITAFIYGMLLLTYFLEGRIYGLSPYFRIPIFMFFIPSVIGYVGMYSKFRKLKTISQSLIASTLVSGTLILIFSYYVIHLIQLVSTEMYY